MIYGADAKLSIMAVGDDDQNIYAFRHTTVEFIRRFADDYEAKAEYLVENYRSTRHIIAAANDIIQSGPDRLKTDYPIRINHARHDHPAGGRWERLDPLIKGHVHIMQSPPDGNRQTQLAMAEFGRLKALDEKADWSDFAVLARTHAMLEPVRAWCEWKKIPYLMAESGKGQPELHKTREGRSLITLLQSKRRKLLRHGVLKRWLRKSFIPNPDNPWLELLGQCIAEIEDAWGGMPIPTGQALEWVYEFGSESRNRVAGHVTLSTVHGAKGREFTHVIILDGGDWKDDRRGDERRLFYVAMTRAMETLTLCEATSRPHPFIGDMGDGENFLRTPLASIPNPLCELDKKYALLGLADVDLGFAGRKPANDPVHRAIRALRVGDPLQWADAGGRLELRNGQGITVGRLAQKVRLPVGTMESVTVSAIVHRSKRQAQDAEWAKTCKVDEWEVVLGSICLSGQSEAVGTKAGVSSVGED